MIYTWFTGINYYKLAVEKDRDSSFTTITTIWKPGLSGKGYVVRNLDRRVSGLYNETYRWENKSYLYPSCDVVHSERKPMDCTLLIVEISPKTKTIRKRCKGIESHGNALRAWWQLVRPF
jgi:hypothetical protein